MQSSKLILPIIVFVACLSQSASDIYLPSIPSIAHVMHISMSYAELTIPIYLIGLSLSQLVYGPLSEGMGRRVPLLIGLTIMIMGSLICSMATGITTLLIGRFIQGCGAGASAALFRSIFRDLYQGEELAKYGSILSIVVTFVLPAMPMLGGYLETYFSWRAPFIFLSFYTIGTILLVVFNLKESSVHHHRSRLKLSFILSAYKQILNSQIFWAYTLVAFLAYGGFFAWITAAPEILIKQLGFSPVAFGWMSLMSSAVTMGVGALINSKLVGKYGMINMLQLGLSVMLLGGVLLVLDYYLLQVNVITIMLPVLIFILGTTFIWPNAFAGAFTPFGKLAGYTGALYGSLQIAGGALTGTLIAHLPTSNQLPLAMIFLSVSLVGLGAFNYLLSYANAEVRRQS